MLHTQSTTKKFAVRIFATLAALSVLLVPFAFAADQTMTATVAPVNTFSITAGTSVTLTPTVALADADATTVLSFDTNDGITYKITVVADLWVFTPAVGAAATTTAYPELRFVSAESSAGTASTTPGVLISAGNTPSTALDIVTGITSAAGTATVTLDASITQTVVAGSYATTLTYAITTP